MLMNDKVKSETENVDPANIRKNVDKPDMTPPDDRPDFLKDGKAQTKLSIRDFESGIPYSRQELTLTIAYLVNNRESLTAEDNAMLRDILPREKPNASLSIDLKEMMQEQMASARSLRESCFDMDGSIRINVDPRDAREALKAAQSIMDTVLKQQEKIDLNSKLMIMEQSLLGIASELPDELQTKFFERVERLLEVQNDG